MLVTTAVETGTDVITSNLTAAAERFLVFALNRMMRQKKMRARTYCGRQKRTSVSRTLPLQGHPFLGVFFFSFFHDFYLQSNTNVYVRPTAEGGLPWEHCCCRRLSFITRILFYEYPSRHQPPRGQNPVRIKGDLMVDLTQGDLSHAKTVRPM